MNSVRGDIIHGGTEFTPTTALRGAGAVSNRKSARVKINTEAPPPKSLEVEPGNETSQDDVSLIG